MVFLIMVFFACSEDGNLDSNINYQLEVTNTDIDSDNMVSRNISTRSVSNPFEIEGIIHNLAIQSTVDSPDFTEMSQRKIYEEIEIQYDRYASELDLENEPDLSFEEAVNNFNNYNENPSVFIEREFNRYNEEVRSNMYKIISLVSESSDERDFTERLSIMTSELLNNEYLNTNDKEILLSTLAVTDYSVHFWHERGDVDFGEPLDLIEKRIVWLADTVGFIRGIFILRPRGLARLNSALARLENSLNNP